MRIPWLRRRAERRDCEAHQNLTLLRTPGPNILGPREEWPWGQNPAVYMIDPDGFAAGPLGDPNGWIAAHRSNIEHGFRTTLRRGDQ